MTNLIRHVPSTLLGRPILQFRDDIFFPIEQHFNKIFDEFFTGSSLDSVKGKSGYPKLEMSTEGSDFIIRIAIPGCEPDDVQVEITSQFDTDVVETRTLHIAGRMSEEYQSPEGAKFFCKELLKREFHREVVIPSEIVGDPDAVIKNGILCLTWPLPVPEENKYKTRQINIRTDDSVMDDGGGGE